MTNHDKPKYDEEAAIQAAQERNAEPPLRDILKREHDEAQKRPRNVALEKRGDEIVRMLWEGLRIPPEYLGGAQRSKKRDEDLDR